MIYSFLTPEKVHPTRNRVLIEPIFKKYRFGPNGEVPLLVPLEHQRRYPQMGRVINAHWMTGLERGNYVVLEDEGEQFDRTYYDCFQIILMYEGEQVVLTVDNEIEPAFREFVEAYRANPSTHDLRITVQDVETGYWNFLCSDVLHYGYERMAHPTYTLEYIPTFMIELYNEKARKHKLYYIIHYSKIMATLRRVRADDSTI